MQILMILLFALALNMDTLATGISYGIRKIKIPFYSMLIICSMSFLSIVASMSAGKLLFSLISVAAAKRLGGCILLLIGLWIFLQSWQEIRANKRKSTNEIIKKTILQIHIKSLGLVINILREPSIADLDRSGIICAKEALLLGFALSMDAFGAGIAVAMFGFNVPLTASIVATGQIIMTYSGLFFGRRFGNTKLGQKMAILPGIILITLALTKIC